MYKYNPRIRLSDARTLILKVVGYRSGLHSYVYTLTAHHLYG